MVSKSHLTITLFVLQALMREYKIGTECPQIIQRCKCQQTVTGKGEFGQ